MFISRLGSERTFFLIPDSATDLHLPTDLSGITHGTYDVQRRDHAWQQATGPFCTKVRRKIESDGFRRKQQHERLDNLAVAYACCEWIPDQQPYDGMPRWKRKDQIFDRMIQQCRCEPPNKGWLAARNLDVLSLPVLDYLASKMCVIAAISARPERSDVDLLLEASLDNLPDGHARIRALYAAKNVADAFQISKTEIQQLTKWQSITSGEHYVRDAQQLLGASLTRTK